MKFQMDYQSFCPCLVGQPGVYGNYVFNVQSIKMGDEVDLWTFVEAETAGMKKDCPCQIKTDE